MLFSSTDQLNNYGQNLQVPWQEQNLWNLLCIHCGQLAISGIPHCSCLNVHAAHTTYMPGWEPQHQALSLYQHRWQLHSHFLMKSLVSAMYYHKRYHNRLFQFHYSHFVPLDFLPPRLPGSYYPLPLTSCKLWSRLKSWYSFWQPEGEACLLAYKTFWHWYAPFQGFSCCKQGVCLLRSFFLVALRYKMNISSHSFHTNANSRHSPFC